MKAAHHTGKAHALAKEGYNCHYDDMEEARMYHEGFKQGLDECYGQAPIQGMVEANPVVDDMASFGAHTPSIADEGNAFTGALARTPHGGQFKVGGNSFVDNSTLDEFVQAFESWDQQLNTLLTEDEEVTEGMTVSISKGQQGSPDSVSVSAQDGDADQLLALIKSAGLGLFGGEHEGFSPTDGEASSSPGGIEVVDDHDGMMALMKKMTGGGEEGGEEEEGYADEEKPDSEEQTDSDEGESQDQVDEVESRDQLAYQVAENNPPDSGAAETSSDENAEAEEDSALSTADAGQDDEEGEEEETVEESLANGADDTFEADINFMTNIITGGLNDKKSTGQSTVPVVSTQVDRLGNPMSESIDLLHDWTKLAGIK